MENTANLFAVCIDNTGFEASLEVSKLYKIVADKEAEIDGMLRIIDEDGEDYLYQSQHFFPLNVPSQLAIALHQNR